MNPAIMEPARQARSSKGMGNFNSIPSTPIPIPINAPPPPHPSAGGYDFVTPPVYQTDPFGFQNIPPTVEETWEIRRKISWHERVINYLKSEVSELKDRAINAFKARRPRNEVLEVVDTVHPEVPGETDEDIGTRKARAVSRNWSRSNLTACYTCLVILVSFYGLGSTNSVLVIEEAMHDFAMRGDIKIYQFELALSMLDVSKIIGIIIFAKLTNTRSRPFALLAAVLVAAGGMSLTALSVTWESFSAGNALVQLGMSGALLVSQVIVADTSDLSWRGTCLWGLQMSSVLWIWTKPAVAQAIAGKVQWNVPVWGFFGLSIPVMIPSLVVSYIPHLRAKHGGFFPPLSHAHNHIWWDPKGTLRRIRLLSCELDPLGMFLWVSGLGLLSTAVSLSEKMQAGIGIWMVVLLTSGSLCIILLSLWECYLNEGLNAEHKKQRQKSQHQHQHPRVTWGALPGEREMIMGPAAPQGYNSCSIEQAAAELSASIAKSQEEGKLNGWGKFCNSYRKKCHPLFRERLLGTHTTPVACAIGLFANFSMKLGSWSLWDRPENLPTPYTRIIESLQGNQALMNVEFTSVIVGGFFVGFLIRLTRTCRSFVTCGLFLMICGLLIFQYTDVYLIQTFQIFMSQVIIGFGAGMVWISLLVCVSASCKSHSDVGISIGLLTTSNALGEMAAGAMKRSMQAYMMNILPPESPTQFFLRALSGHWSIMLIIAVAAAALALLLTSIGLTGCNLDRVKQHVSGVVFGRDDADRHNLNVPDLEGQASSLVPSPSFSTPEIHVAHPNATTSSPCPTHLEGIRTAENRNSILLERQERFQGACLPSGSKSLFSKNRVTETIGNARENSRPGSTEWGTAPSGPGKIPRATSNLSMALSQTQLSEDYEDCVFTMDSDIDEVPKNSQNGGSNESAASFHLLFKGRKLGSLPSVPKNILEPRPKGGYILKRKASPNKMKAEAGDRATLSELTSNKEGSDCAPSNSREPIDIKGSFDVQTPADLQALDEGGPNVTNNRTLPSSPAREPGDFGVGSVSPDFHTAVAALSSDGEQELAQRWQSWVEDGDISDIPSAANELSEEESNLPSNHHGLAQITSEVKALSYKNSYSPEVKLPTIEEHNSQGSATNSVDLTFIGGAGSQLEARPPLVIGVLSPYHRHQSRGESSTSGTQENAASGPKQKKRRVKGRKRSVSC